MKNNKLASFVPAPPVARRAKVIPFDDEETARQDLEYCWRLQMFEEDKPFEIPKADRAAVRQALIDAYRDLAVDAKTARDRLYYARQLRSLK